MARKDKTVIITVDGRDKGKQFIITELPADQAERWAIRLLLALTRAGAMLPDGALDAGMAGLARTVGASMVVGLRAIAGLRFEDAEPLLAVMMGCVQYKPPTAGIPPQPIFDGEGSQIEEVTTRLRLRMEVLQLHLNFSLPDFLSTSDTSRQAP